MLKMAPLDCAINELWQCWRRTGHLPSFSSSPQGIDSVRVPTPQNLPSKAKQMLMPGGQPGGGGGRQGMGWGVDCRCWIWGRAFNICLILFSQVWGYLNLSLPDVEIFDCRLGQKRLRLNICFPLPHFTHAPHGLERSGNHGGQREQAKAGWISLFCLQISFVLPCFWSTEPTKILWYQSKRK